MSSLFCNGVLHSSAVLPTWSYALATMSRNATLTHAQRISPCLARAEVKPRMSNFPSPLALYDDMSTPEVVLECVHLVGM